MVYTSILQRSIGPYFNFWISFKISLITISCQGVFAMNDSFYPNFTLQERRAHTIIYSDLVDRIGRIFIGDNKPEMRSISENNQQGIS